MPNLNRIVIMMHMNHFKREPASRVGVAQRSWSDFDANVTSNNHELKAIK